MCNESSGLDSAGIATMLFDWGLEFQTVIFDKLFCVGENVDFKILEAVHVCNGTRKDLKPEGWKCVTLSYTH